MRPSLRKLSEYSHTLNYGCHKNFSNFHSLQIVKLVSRETGHVWHNIQQNCGWVYEIRKDTNTHTNSNRFSETWQSIHTLQIITPRTPITHIVIYSLSSLHHNNFDFLIFFFINPAEPHCANSKFTTNNLIARLIHSIDYATIHVYFHLLSNMHKIFRFEKFHAWMKLF